MISENRNIKHQTFWSIIIELIFNMDLIIRCKIFYNIIRNINWIRINKEKSFLDTRFMHFAKNVARNFFVWISTSIDWTKKKKRENNRSRKLDGSNVVTRTYLSSDKFKWSDVASLSRTKITTSFHNSCCRLLMFFFYFHRLFFCSIDSSQKQVFAYEYLNEIYSSLYLFATFKEQKKANYCTHVYIYIYSNFRISNMNVCVTYILKS